MWLDLLGASPWIVLGAMMVFAVCWNVWHGGPWHGGSRRRETVAQKKARGRAQVEANKAAYRAKGKRIPEWWP